MNEEKTVDQRKCEDLEPVAVVVIDTLEKREYKVQRRRVPELDSWAELYNHMPR